MAHFAKVVNGRVEEVRVVEQDVIDSGALGDPSLWIQTSYNTHRGVHVLGGTPLRMNFASVGGYYDAEADAFYAQSPYPSWVLNKEIFDWEAPVPHPPAEEGKQYLWDEDKQEWEAVTVEA